MILLHLIKSLFINKMSILIFVTFFFFAQPKGKISKFLLKPVGLKLSFSS